jgi:hypothetical protein
MLPFNYYFIVCVFLLVSVSIVFYVIMFNSFLISLTFYLVVFRYYHLDRSNGKSRNLLKSLLLYF